VSIRPKFSARLLQKKELVGVDVFVRWNGTHPDELATKLQQMENNDIKLTMITNRGIKVWPEGFNETFCTHHWRCRFKPTKSSIIAKSVIIQLLSNAEHNNINTMKTEILYAFDGKQAYSLGQGQ
jgi:isocitrate dehydrogenase